VQQLVVKLVNTFHHSEFICELVAFI